MKRCWLLLLGIWFWAASAWAAEVMPAKPAQYFNDYAGVVSPTIAQELNSELEDFEKQTSNQVVVVVYPKMESDSSLEDYTHRLAESWQAGQAGKNNGIVLFVFVQDHRLRIEVGYGLEGALPDALAKRIEDDDIAPHFRVGDYDDGLLRGVSAILKATQGEYKGDGSTANENETGGSLIENVFGLIVAIAFIALYIAYLRFFYTRYGTVYGSGGRRGYSSGPFLGGFGGGFGGGGFGGDGGGGGGFSGGGGHFGGGGASGSW